MEKAFTDIPVPGESLLGQRVNKATDMVFRFFRNLFVKVADLVDKFINGVLTIEELPYAGAGAVHAKTAKSRSGIGIEEHSPVVKLLSEDDKRIA